MKHYFVFFLAFSATLFGDVTVTENEPSALVEGIVNVITGDLYALEDDIIIEGAEPLRLRRNYISANGNGRWSFFENLTATLYPSNNILSVKEPNGTVLIYRYEQKQSKHKKKKKRSKEKKQQKHFHPLNLNEDAKGLTNTARGKISAHTNLKNQYVTMDSDSEQFTIICPNGSKKTYKAISNQEPVKLKGSVGEMKIHVIYAYHLQSEELPNGNKILYDWRHGKLQSIRTTDPSGKKTYAQATFQFHGELKEKHGQRYWNTPNFNVQTSDGRVLQYRHFFDGKHKSEGIWHLHQILSSDSPDETIHYYSREKYRKRILSSISLPLSRDLQIGYYSHQNDPLSGRVQFLSAPVGDDNVSVVTHRFDYNLSKKMTSVLDSDNIPTHYYWDENLRLTRIDRFLTPQTLYNSSLFVWGSNNSSDAANLICKILCDESNQPIHATTRSYDHRGNVLLEKFYGNLSGKGSPLTIDSNHLPIEDGVESCVTKFEYSQDGRNLLLRKEDKNGLVVTYEYLPNTDLPIAEFYYEDNQIKRRKFYEYNSDHIQIREITDDGTTQNKNDLSGVKTRYIQQIKPKSDAPFLNMPHVIEDKYWDGSSEKLLKKTCLHYTTGGRIEKKDIYDANDIFQYSLKYKYNEKGRLIEETNAIGQTAFSDYDELGNKKYYKDFGGRSHLEMSYDFSNRLIESKESGDDGCRQTTLYGYDKKHNKTSVIDTFGNETLFVYDSQNQLRETHLPPIEDIQPIISSSYNAAGQEITRTDAKGHITSTTYNAYGEPILILYPDKTEESFIYNLDGTLHTHIDQNGVETAYLYDVFGRMTTLTKNFNQEVLSQTVFHYDAFHLIAKTDPEGNLTTYEYDGAGRKTAEEINKERTEYSYDPLGHLHCVKTNELLSITEYDFLDRIVEERKEDEERAVFSKIVYSYDNAGNKRTITRSIEGKEAVSLFEYDSFNRLIQEKDALSNIITTIYDDEHHTQTTIDPLGLQIFKAYNSHNLISFIEKRSRKNELLIRDENEYDANDNLITKKSTIFNPNRTSVTRWDYGPLDRPQTLIEAAETNEQKITQFTYTPKGLIFQRIKPSGIVLTNTYNPLDYLSCQSSSDDSIHYTYMHNRLGHLLQSTDELQKATLIRTHDPKGRLLTEELPTKLFFQNKYDTQGRRIRLDLPDSTYILYEYDPLYLHKVIRYTHSNHPAYMHTYTKYDLSENLLSQDLIGNLSTVVRSYDPTGRSISSSSPHFSHTILQYDFVGNVLKAQLHDETHEYTYNDLYQLISEKEHTYTYDSLYNRLQKDSATYAINSLNQIASEFQYNDDGNPYLHKDACFTYDALDRLILVENSTTKLQFTYDSFHRRLSKTVYSRKNNQWKQIQTLFFLYDGQNEIGSIDSSGKIQELRILGRASQAEIGSAIAFELQGKVYAPLYDLHGNVAKIISLSNETHEKYHYSAFGEEKDPKPTLNPWRFSSKRIDEETGFVYFGRRYYLPSYGRWLTPDPLGLDAGPNLYAYVSNSPLTHVDLYGLYSISTEDIKQMSIGAVHGLGNFALNTASAVSTVGWGLTTPVRAVKWMAGKSNFSQDWNSFQRSNAAFYSMGERWMQTALPANRNHDMYRSSRGGISSGLELGTATLGGIGIAKGAYSLIQTGYRATKGMLTMQKIGRSPIAVTRLSSKDVKLQTQQWRFPENPNDLLIKLPRDQKINNAVRSIEDYFGGRGKIITNSDGDMVLMQGNKKIRFDIMDPHGDKPHFHLEKKAPNGKWIDASPEHRYYFTKE